MFVLLCVFLFELHCVTEKQRQASSGMCLRLLLCLLAALGSKATKYAFCLERERGEHVLLWCGGWWCFHFCSNYLGTSQVNLVLGASAAGQNLLAVLTWFRNQG